MSAFVVAIISPQASASRMELFAQHQSEVEAFGGRYLAKNGYKVGLEGLFPDEMVEIMEFASIADAEHWHQSSMLFRAPLRGRGDDETWRVFIVEGSPRLAGIEAAPKDASAAVKPYVTGDSSPPFGEHGAADSLPTDTCQAAQKFCYG